MILRVELSDQLTNRLDNMSIHHGAKSHITRMALELYLTLREKGVLDGTEQAEQLRLIAEKMRQL
jgi:predicted transcriptional regulator